MNSNILRRAAMTALLAALLILTAAGADAFSTLPDGDALLAKYSDQITKVYAGADAYRGTLYSGTPRKNFALLMMSDTHGDTERLENAIAILNSCEVIDAAVHLGDVEYSNYGGGDAARAVSVFSEATKPVFAVMGNHDGREKATRNCTVEQAVDRLLKPMPTGYIYSDRGYGFQDFDAYRIRLILLNCCDYPDDRDGDAYLYYGADSVYRQGQIDWFVSTLASTPDDYTVIVAMHNAEPTTIDLGTTPQHVGTIGVSGASGERGTTGAMDGTVISDIVDAFIRRTSLERTYSYLRGGSETGVTVSADFSRRGDSRFACYLCGHHHCQGIGSVTNHPEQVVYFHDSSALFSGGNMWTSYTSLFPRAAGQKSEDLLTVLCVDPLNRTLNFVRIGAHINMFGEDSGFIHYRY